MAMTVVHGLRGIRCLVMRQHAKAQYLLDNALLDAPLHEGWPVPKRRQGDDDKPRTRHAERRFAVGGEGWAVWEDLRNLTGPSLVFENAKIARRIHQYPANWRELSDEELYALSWSR